MLRHFVQFFLLFEATFKAASIRHSEFFQHNYELYANDKYINETQVKEKCDVNTMAKPCKYTPELQFYMTSELKNPWINIKGVHVSDNGTFIDQTFNVCTFDKLPMLNVFINVFYELFKKNINFDMKCPFKKGLYIVKPWKNDYNLASTLMLPENPDRYSLTCKQKIGKKYETVWRFSYDMMTVWVD